MSNRNNTDKQFGEPRLSLVEMWGHKPFMKEDGTIKCATCRFEAEIPTLFQETTGFREVLYKLYVYGQFKQVDCSRDIDRLEKEYKNLRDPITDKSNYNVDKDRINWSLRSSDSQKI